MQTMIQGLGNASGSAVIHAAGVPNVLSNDTSGFQAALDTAAAADQVVLYLGIDGTVEGEGHDRHTIGQCPQLANLCLSRPGPLLLFCVGRAPRAAPRVCRC